MDLNLPPVPVATLARVAGGTPRDVGDVAVADASYDSRSTGPGDLFFCVPGERHDGHCFADEAIRAGAAALVVERWLPVAGPQVLVPSVRSAMGPISAALFGEPAAELLMLGVTGTDGKTTTTYLLEAVLREAGMRSAVIGTTGARIDREPVTLEHTTPEAPDLQRLLARMCAAGVSAVAMEVSSHALAYERVRGIRFDVSGFTNLSQDHLDLHGSMEAYYQAKRSLFTPTTTRSGAINADDAWGRRLLEEATVPRRSFGFVGDADLSASGLVADRSGCRFVVGAQHVRTSLLGAFNASNALCAFAMAELAGIAPWVAADGISRLSGVPGRLEPIDAGQAFLVVVDYAHTPDSIQHVLRGARPLVTGRTIIVFGCGGDRDRAKRPRMGAAATALADLTVITSDNPRSEDPDAIIRAVVDGARTNDGAFVVEPDREAAIEIAIAAAEPGDAVIIAGKGHETVQEIGDTQMPFDDRAVARAAILAVGSGS